MAPRPRPSGRTRPSRRASTSRRGSDRRGWRLPRWLLLAVLAVVVLVALERTGALPERVAVVIRSAEEWLAPILEEAGVNLPPRETEPGSKPQRSDDAAAVAQALSLLQRIPVETERPRGYDREAWRHWLDADGDCQDARQEVLAAESLEPVRWDAEGCDVVSGLWRDVYTGETFRDPRALDVDHMVPLAEAYRSGGRDWSTERRGAYANDLEDSRSLIAVSASANRSKGDQGPEEWLPPDAAHRCIYVANWVAVKVRWSLSMDESERVTVGNILTGCAEG